MIANITTKQATIAASAKYYTNPKHYHKKIKQTLQNQQTIIIKNIYFGFLCARGAVYIFFVSNVYTLLACAALLMTELYLYRKVFDNEQV